MLMPKFIPTTNPDAEGKLYARLSHTKDGTDISIERQVRMGMDWFQANGISEIGVYVEPKGHRSGTSDEYRPAYQQLLTDLKKGDTLWCHDQSRFTRADDAPMVLKKLHKRGVRMIFYDQRVDVESSTGMMNVRLRSLMNAQYATSVSEGQTKAYKDFKQAGAYYTRKRAFGIEGVGHGVNRRKVATRKGVWRSGEFVVLGNRNECPFVPSARAQFFGFIDLVRAFFELYVTADMGYAPCAKRLREQGWMTQDESGTPRPVTEIDVRSLRLHIERYRGVLDDTLLDRMTAKVKERKGNPGAGRRLRVNAQPPLLWRLLVCAECKGRYRVGWEPSRQRYDYRHGHLPCNLRGHYSAVKLEKQLWQFLERLKLPLEDRHALAREFLAQYQRAPSPQLQSNAAKRAEIEKGKLNLKRLLALERITDADFDKLLAEFDTELRALPADLVEASNGWRNTSAEEIVEMWEHAAETLKRAAELDTRIVNLTLRDLFERIEIDQDARLRFEVREVFQPMFAPPAN